MRKTSALLAAVAAVGFVCPAMAATRIWFGDENGQWAEVLNWDDAATVPAPGDTIIFSTSPNQTIDTGADRVVAQLLFSAPAAYTFNNNTLTVGGVSLLGNGPVVFNSNLTLNNVINVTGLGTNGMTANGVVSGAGGGLSVTSARVVLSNTGNSFDGGTVIGAGAVVELLGPTASPQQIVVGATGNSLIGAGAIMLDGGTLKLTSRGFDTISGYTDGGINFNRAVSFSANGGVVDITNGTGDWALGASGQIVGGSIPINTTSGATGVAVIKFNGGNHGLSRTVDSLNHGDWNSGQNALRFGAITGDGPIRVELTNGALHRGSDGTSGGTLAIANPYTISGVAGGDPTSGPAGLNNSGISRTTGRFGLDQRAQIDFNAGLFFEGAVQVGALGATRAINGNVTLRGIDSGNPAVVAFSGRGTGANFAAGAVNDPGSNAAGHNVLWLGRGGDDTLTVENGAAAILDLRIRSDQGFHHAVLLDAKTVLNAGGKLDFRQSLSSFSVLTYPTGAAPSPLTVASVGNHIVRGSIEGQGTSTQESVVDIHLPFDNTFGNTTAGNHPLGGVVFEASSGLVVNGTGTGGLRVNGLARPNNLFEGGAADPVSNADKVANLLSVSRLANLTGTGGYLTPAPVDKPFIMLAGSEWSSAVPVGLKVINSNTNPAESDGVDVILQTDWSHNVLVSGGATLSAAGRTLAGTVLGNGSIVGPVSIGTNGTLSPGLSAGALSILGDLAIADNATYSVELLGLTPGTEYDQVLLSGELSLAANALLSVSLGFDPQLGDAFSIVTGGVTGIDGQFAGLPQGAIFWVTNPNSGNDFPFQISYQGGAGNDVMLTVAVPEPGTAGLLALGALLGLSRVRRRA